MSNSFQSYHAFLFPFEWRHRGKADDLLEDQTSLAPIPELMRDGPGNWTRRDGWAEPKSLTQYNENAYFYDFVRPVLYDTGKSDSLQLHYYFDRAEWPDLQYLITLDDGKQYILEVDDIVVSYYDTGVGVIAFHCYNRRADQAEPIDILRINAYGRRLYPPFMATDTNLIGTQAFFDDDHWETGLSGAKKFEIANRLAFVSGDKELAADDFTSWHTTHGTNRVPELIKKLLPDSVTDKLEIHPVLDDRMYVVTWYGNDRLVSELTAKEPDETYKQHDWWYQYVFVDTGFRTCRSQRMMSDLLTSVTNARWNDQGTLFGVSRYSFVALTNRPSTDNSFPWLICSHVQTMYYKIAQLGLVQRASLLRFSQEVTDISELRRSDRQIATRVSSLYKQYIRFTNRVYFREVTAQEQGIELYDTLQDRMRLRDQVAALDREIKDLHQYVMILDEEVRNDKLDILAIIGAFFVVPSFVGTYFGIGEYNTSDYWLPISVACVAAAGLAYGVLKSRKDTTARSVFIILLVLLMLALLFLFPLTPSIWSE